MPDQDVTPASSTGEPADSNSAAADSSAVITDVTTEELDRPVQNIRAEFDRKLGAQQRQLTDLTTLLTAVLSQQYPQQQQPQSQPQAQQEQFDQLSPDQRAAVIAQQAAAQQVAQFTAVQQQANFINAQLQHLYNRYPALRDSSHPLTQAALQAKQTLVMNGWPNNRATDLEAIKVAIADNADNPAVITQTAGRPAHLQDVSRRSAVSAQEAAATTVTSTARPGRPRAGVRQLSQQEIAIAKRMGVTDPEKALQRLIERQKKGQSSVSPTISMMVGDLEGGA